MATRGNDISMVVNDLLAGEARWFAVYTKYKAEKYVADNLRRKRIEAYVPLLTTTKQYTRKVKTYEVPLLNCFVFVKITKVQYAQVLESEYVYHFVKQGKNLVSIPDMEIDLLRRIVGELEAIQTGPINYQDGQPVEIISGNLTGIKGVLVQQKSRQIFVVRLDYVGVQLEMEVDKSLLAYCSKASTVA